MKKYTDNNVLNHVIDAFRKKAKHMIEMGDFDYSVCLYEAQNTYYPYSSTYGKVRRICEENMELLDQKCREVLLSLQKAMKVRDIRETYCRAKLEDALMDMGFEYSIVRRGDYAFTLVVAISDKQVLSLPISFKKIEEDNCLADFEALVSSIACIADRFGMLAINTRADH